MRQLTKRPGVALLCIVIGVVALAAMIGVSVAVHRLRGVDKDYPIAGTDDPALRVVGTWEASRGLGIRNREARGFAGRIKFLTKTSTPATVDGSLDIYLFDDQGTEEENETPIHRFQYSPEVWAICARKTNDGPIYEVFVPYTRDGNHAAKCDLVVKFTPKDGPAILSDLVTVALHGENQADD